MNAPVSSPMPRYLVCLDSSEAARMALRVACMLAKKRGAAIDLLHVIAPAGEKTLFGVAEIMRQDQQQEARQMVHALAREVEAEGIAVRSLVREGKPGEEIIAQTIEDADTLMVLLGAGHSDTRGKLVGYLSAKMGEKLLLPLMVVPANLTEQQMNALV